MSAVVEAIEGIGDGINKYIIEPIKNDPLTFLATMAAATFAGPGAFGIAGAGYGAAGMGLAAGAANAAAGLVQGEDFDEALKGGVMAGLGTYAGASLSGVGSTTPSSTASLQSGIASTADEFAAAGTQSVDDIFTTAAKQSADDFLNPGNSSYTGSTTSPTFSAANISGSAGDDVAAGLGDDLFNPIDENIGMAGKGPNVGYGKPSSQLPNATTTDAAGNAMGRDMYGNYTNAPNPPGQSVYTGQKISGAGAQRAFDTSANVLDESATAANAFDDPLYYDKLAAKQASIPRTAAETSADILDSPMLKVGTNKAGMSSPPVPPSTWDKALGYGKDAYNLVVDNPFTSATIGLGLASLGQGKDEPSEGGGKNEEIGDPGFYDPMRLYKYNRDRVGYGGDITQYGQSGGEHQFFTPTVYEPIQYAAGGSVAPDNYGYYTYGNIPPTMKRFAQGGLSALAKGGNYDGRSDDIPAVLSDGEFVIDAETVALLGNGSSKAGANRLEEMRQAVRKQKGGALSRGQFSPDAKSPLAYLKSSKKSRG
jgi:hypothetical protein